MRLCLTIKLINLIYLDYVYFGLLKALGLVGQGLGLLSKIHFNSMWVNKDFLTWLLIGCAASQSDAKFENLSTQAPGL